jgi:hypothetical protein
MFEFFDRRSAERFAELLDETNGGRRHRTRGPADEQLAELVVIGHSLSAARSGVQVDAEFRGGLRAMLIATAERDGIGATATAVETEPAVPAGVREPGRGILQLGTGRRIRARGAIVIGVAAGAMAVSGISAASENASPGDALYGVKRSTERAQLAMAGSDNTRGQLSLNFARTRLAEAAAMSGDDPSFGRVLTDMDNDTRQGVRLLTGSALARKDAAPLSTVDRFVGAQRKTLEGLDDLSSGNRERALASLKILDDAHQRAASLRTGLACGTVSPAGADALGPRLGDCVTGSDSSTSPQRQQGTSGKQVTKPDSSHQGRPKREPADPTARPDASRLAVVPGAKATASPGVSRRAAVSGTDSADTTDLEPMSDRPTPTQTAWPADDDLLNGILRGRAGLGKLN